MEQADREDGEDFLNPEMEARIAEALRNARDPLDEEVAVSARYDASSDALIVQLKSGQRLALPREDIQGLAEAAPERVAAVEIVGPGTALHWEELDTDFGVAGLAKGIYGNRWWMAELPRLRRERLSRAS